MGHFPQSNTSSRAKTDTMRPKNPSDGPMKADKHLAVPRHGIGAIAAADIYLNYHYWPIR
jgi:hypothetical protein